MKNKILLLFAIVLALPATSCNDWLDVQPNTMKSAETMFDTYQGYKDALTGCYITMKMQSLYGLNMTVTSVEYLAQHWEIWSGSDVIDAIKKHDYEDDNVKPVFQNIYNGLYNIIVQANTIIEAMPLTGEKAIANPQARGVIEGEAYAIRAMCHFEVLRLFGQVPGGSTSVRLPYTEDVSREPKDYYGYQDFVSKIERDLTKAATLLGEHDPFIEYNVTQVNNLANSNGIVADEYMRYRQLRLNYWAVKALQARFYTYTGKTAEAYAAATEVITASNDGKGFALAGRSSIEAYYYALPSEGLFMLSNYQLVDYIYDYFRGEGTTWVNLYMSPERMEGNDTTFGMFGESYNASTNNRFKGLWRNKQSMNSGVRVYELLKYDQDDAAGMSATILLLNKQIMPMLRLSEMYLVAMEFSNDLSEINGLYDTYRKAREINTVTTFTDKHEVLQMIETEYRREFFGEGQMFGFYKRNKSATMAWSTKTMTEADYIIPLPVTEFDPNI